MATRDVLVLNTTASRAETQQGSDTVVIRGNSGEALSVENSSGTNVLSVNTVSSSVDVAGKITATTEFWTGAFVTGSADTYNNFQPSANGDGRYLLTKKIPASYSPGCAGGGSTSSEEDFGGGY